MAVEIERVECEIGEPVCLPSDDRVVEIVDVGHAAIIRHRHFAVYDDLAPARQQLPERSAEQWRPVVPASGNQLQPGAIVQDRDDPMAMLDLMQSAVALRRPGAGDTI